ncbi:MAG: division/cell wall cluster transcriptional repressor MraZ [Rhodospirillales bacterium]|nr:division/cell wall cluster transcriptional repressor MraZ [Rhodospirillales bacterium]
MALFLSRFNFKVDRKGRVSVPADYRSALAGQSFAGIIAFPSLTDRAIRACGIDLMEQISGQRNPLTVFEQTPTDLALASVPEVMRLPFDGEGRIVLPAELARHAGVADAATFVGRLNYFEIWNPTAFEAHQEQMRAAIRAGGGPLPGAPGGKG